MRRQGFSIIEITVVLVVLGILMAIATPNYRRWRAHVQVRQVAEQFAQDINKQRSEAKRTNSTKAISFTSNAYTLNGITHSMPAQITFEAVGSTADLSFQNPYGSTTEPLRTFRIRHASDASIERIVRVVGVMGKVIIQ